MQISLQSHEMPNLAFRQIAFFCAALVIAWLPPRVAHAQSVWELTPYRVHFAVWTANAAEFTPLWRQDLHAELVRRAESTFAAAWETSAGDCPAEIAEATLSLAHIVPAKSLPADWRSGFDKLIIVRAVPADGGYDVRTRELDLSTELWSPPQQTLAADPATVAIEAFRLAVQGFAPLAKVEKVEGKTIELQLRAAGLPPADPGVRLIPPAAVYRPAIRFNDRDGNARRIEVIEWTYLTTTSITGTTVTCGLQTGLRNPLVARLRGRTQQFALAVLPPRQPTELRLVSRTNAKRGLAGFDVFTHPADSERTVLLGQTDWRGSLLVPPAPEGESPLRILLVKHGAEILAKLPVLPGLEAKLEASLSDDQERLSVEGFIVGLQEELVDTVAQREVLILRIHARLQQGQQPEAAKFLEELRALKTREQFLAMLSERRKTVTTTDPRVRKSIDKLFSDTQKVLNQHLSPTQIDDVAREVGGVVK